MAQFPHIPNYEVLSRVGFFGNVFKAKDERSGEIVALKSFPSTVKGGRQFQKELALMASINHPNILGFRDVIYSQGGRHYLVLDFAEGGSLRDHLAQGAFSKDEALAVILDVAKGLSAAHKLGLVHRDLKPDNILCAKPKTSETAASYQIADLGIAQSISDFSKEVTGSPAYMAPEQFYDQASTSSDLYALGIILWELLTGREPFEGSHQELCVAHCQEEPDFLKIEDLDCRNFLRNLLQKKPKQRVSDADKVVDLCASLLGLASARDPGTAPASTQASWSKAWRKESPGSQRLFQPHPKTDDTFWLSDGLATDVYEGGRYHPRYLSRSLESLSPALGDEGHFFYATSNEVFRGGASRRSDVRLFQNHRSLHCLLHDEEHLYLLDHRRVEACDHSGAKMWHKPCQNFVLDPLICLHTSDTLLVACGGAKHEIQCLQRSTGELLWSLEIPGMPTAIAPITDSGFFDLTFIDVSSTKGTRLTRWRHDGKERVEAETYPVSVRSIRAHIGGMVQCTADELSLWDHHKNCLAKFEIEGDVLSELWFPEQGAFVFLESVRGRTYLNYRKIPGSQTGESHV